MKRVQLPVDIARAIDDLVSAAQQAARMGGNFTAAGIRDAERRILVALILNAINTEGES